MEVEKAITSRMKNGMFLPRPLRYISLLYITQAIYGYVLNSVWKVMVSSRLVTRYNTSDLHITASRTAQAGVEQKVLTSDHCAEELVN